MTDRYDKIPKVDIEAGGEFLVRTRLQQGLTRSNFISYTGERITTTDLGKLERGAKSKVSLQDIVNLSHIHDLPIETIIEAYGIPTSHDQDPQAVALSGLISQLNPAHKKAVLDTISLLVKQLKAAEK